MLTLFDQVDIASDSALHIPDVQFCFSVSNASWNRGLKAPVIIFSLMSSTCDGSTRGGLLSYPFAALRLQLNTSCTLREHFLLIPHLDATGATCLLCLFVSGETFGSCSRPRLPYVQDDVLYLAKRSKFMFIVIVLVGLIVVGVMVVVVVIVTVIIIISSLSS